MPSSYDKTSGRPDGPRRFDMLPDDRDRYSTERVGYPTGTGEAELESSPPPRRLSVETPTLDIPRRWPPPSGPGAFPREPLTVADLMTRNVKTVTSRTSLAEVAALMRDENVGIIPVVDGDGRLDGVVTDRDLVVRGLALDSSRPLRDLPVAAVASAEVDAVSPRESIGEVLDLMGRRQIRRAPVVSEQGRLIGMISLGDIACRAEYDRELQQALHQISSPPSFGRWR